MRAWGDLPRDAFVVFTGISGAGKIGARPTLKSGQTDVHNYRSNLMKLFLDGKLDSV